MVQLSRTQLRKLISEALPPRQMPSELTSSIFTKEWVENKFKQEFEYAWDVLDEDEQEQLIDKKAEIMQDVLWRIEGEAEQHLDDVSDVIAEIGGL